MASNPSVADAPIIERIMRPFQHSSRRRPRAGSCCSLSTAVALGLANSPLAGPTITCGDPARGGDGPVHAGVVAPPLGERRLMAVFFFLVGLEMKREVLVGDLSTRRTAALPVAAALGGMLVPAAALLRVERAREGSRGLGRADGDGHRVRARRTRPARQARADWTPRVPRRARDRRRPRRGLVIAFFYTASMDWSAVAARR